MLLLALKHMQKHKLWKSRTLSSVKWHFPNGTAHKNSLLPWGFGGFFLCHLLVKRWPKEPCSCGFWLWNEYLKYHWENVINWITEIVNYQLRKNLNPPSADSTLHLLNRWSLKTSSKCKKSSLTSRLHSWESGRVLGGEAFSWMTGTCHQSINSTSRNKSVEVDSPPYRSFLLMDFSFSLLCQRNLHTAVVGYMRHLGLILWVSSFFFSILQKTLLRGKEEE